VYSRTQQNTGPESGFCTLLLFATVVGEVGERGLISHSANLRPQHVLSNMSSIWKVLVGDAKLDPVVLTLLNFSL
jgi:hypothetical protein